MKFSVPAQLAHFLQQAGGNPDEFPIWDRRLSVMEQAMAMTEGQTGPAEPKARRTVRIHMNGGMVMEGSLVVPKTRGINELLNGRQPFLEFENANGDKMYLSKPSVQTVQMLDYPRPTGLFAD